MIPNPANSDSTPEALREEVGRLRRQVQFLEEELARSRQALIRAFYSSRPLPFSEEELKQIVAEERGLPLEEFLGVLETAAQGP
jgi:hypothetical protein